MPNLHLSFETNATGATILRVKQQQPPWRVIRGFQAASGELLAHVQVMGERLSSGLAALPGVTEARGVGLLRAAELDRPSGPVVSACFDAGLLVRSTADTIALSPPLIVEKHQIDQMFDTVATALKSVA